MVQKITSIFELTEAVQKNPELSIEVLLETMADEEMIDLDSIKNPNLITNGKVEFDIDKSNHKSIKIVCPFHNAEHNGTGRINLEDQYFKCFKSECSANKPLNVINLYMVLKYNIDPNLISTEEINKNYFAKAVKELADLANIPYELGSKKLSEDEKEAIMINEIRNEFAEIYHDAIHNHANKNFILDYLLETRGFKYGFIPLENLIETYKIGFSPGWSYGYDKIKHKYSNDILLKSGVVKQNQSGKFFDFLSTGVVLPYFSNGKVNNLYARNVKTTDKRFRHLRLKGSVDIPINLDVAKQYKELIFVEGELSWLSMVSLGYYNTVGNRGTEGLANHHIANIKQIKEKTNGEKCNTIYLCFDPDKEGQTAIAKTGERLLVEGFDVRVIRLTEGDPNDFLIHYKSEAKLKMDTLIKEAISYEAFMIGYVLSRSNLSENSSNADVLSALKSVRSFIKKIDKLELLVIIPDIVSYLNSKYITEDLLFNMFIKNEEHIKIENVETDLAYHSFWTFITDKEERFEALMENGAIPNAILINDIDSFIKKTKEIDSLKAFIYDKNISDTNFIKVKNNFPNHEFKVFICDDLETIKNSSKDDILKMIKKSELPFD